MPAYTKTPHDAIKAFEQRIRIRFGHFDGNLNDAIDTIRAMQDKVTQAFERGDIDLATELDHELETGYDAVEHALYAIEEDGPQLASAHSAEATGLNQELHRIGATEDAEHGLEAMLASAYDQEVVNPIGITMSVANLEANLRDCIETFGGNHEGLSFDDLMDMAQDAWANSGRQKAQNRPAKNPAFSHSLLDAEAILHHKKPHTHYHGLTLEDDNEPDPGPSPG
ncbi:MAG: Uncharacterized protein AWU57_184 [Marinobacter sp. T13-3]|nr:MAG: Uncharacterized protein AWU57_184 [Marinobacter sp. T13-3]